MNTVLCISCGENYIEISACMVTVVILLVGGHSFHCDMTDVLFVLLAVCVCLSVCPML